MQVERIADETASKVRGLTGISDLRRIIKAALETVRNGVIAEEREKAKKLADKWFADGVKRSNTFGQHDGIIAAGAILQCTAEELRTVFELVAKD